MSERTVTRDDWLAAVPNLHRVGSEHHGPCPACGGEDRFRVTDTGAAFCRQCAPDGDGYKLLLHAAGLNGASKVRSLPIGAAERTEWRYHDRAGASLVEVVKYVDAKDGKRKTALRHRPEWHPTLKPKKPAKADGWSWSRPGIGGGLLYRVQELHDATDAAPVVVVEGEKDCDRLHRLGFAATCSEGGAEQWGNFHTERMPAGRDVVILADSDKPGMKHAETVATALQNGYRGKGKARSVRIVTPAQLGYPVTASKGKDISDWLDADPARGAADVQALIDAAEVVPEPMALPGREWALMVTPKETPFAECFAAALDVLGVKVRRNLRSGANEVQGMATSEPLDPDGWAPLTGDGTARLFANIEQSVGVPAWRAAPKPWRVGDKNTRLDLVTVAALTRAVDPLIAWFDTLPPATGDNPADTLLVSLFGASQDTEQDARLAAVAMHLLIGTAVYRAYHPGGAQHVTPVLISGWQGQGKSSLAACLLPPGFRAQWFGDGLQLNMSRKEVAEVTAGKVIVEMPEMSGLRRAELATLKSWLTTSDDGQHRGAYKHTAESQPRRWSGIATCDKAEALPHDPAGHRRWLAVAIGPKTVNDMDAALEPVRAQLWAHALKLYRDAAPKVPPALWQHVAEQNRRYEVREPIADERVDMLKPAEWQNGAGLIELMTAVSIDARDHSRNAAAFSAALRAAGWESKRRRTARRWFPPPVVE